MSRLKLEALASSILIYLIIIVSIFSIALYSPNKEIAKNFTEKKSETIEVSLGSPQSSKSYKTINKKKSVKSNKKPKKAVIKKVSKPKKKKVIKKVRNIKHKSHKKSVKKPVKTKVKKSKSQKPKKVNTNSLFKNLPKNISDDKDSSSRPKGNSGKSLKRVNKNRGIVNSYFAKIQNTLKGWPAQSNFAGERVRVKLTVYSTGLFKYKIVSHSLNPEFNRALQRYLEQLKKFGFGSHSSPKPYNIVVEFIAN